MSYKTAHSLTKTSEMLIQVFMVPQSAFVGNYRQLSRERVCIKRKIILAVPTCWSTGYHIIVWIIHQKRLIEDPGTF